METLVNIVVLVAWFLIIVALLRHLYYDFKFKRIETRLINLIDKNMKSSLSKKKNKITSLKNLK